MRLRNSRTEGVVAERLIRPEGWLRLQLGLLVQAPLGENEALWLDPCGSIHTFGMRYSIDVLFLDAELRVLRVAARVPPWRVRLAPWRTRGVIELRAGAAADIACGDHLSVSEQAPGHEARPSND